MSNIIVSRFKLSNIAINWQDTKRPCGMNNILYMGHRHPSRKEINSIKLALTPNECAVLFDANDKAQFIYRCDSF